MAATVTSCMRCPLVTVKICGGATLVLPVTATLQTPRALPVVGAIERC